MNIHFAYRHGKVYPNNITLIGIELAISRAAKFTRTLCSKNIQTKLFENIIFIMASTF